MSTTAKVKSGHNGHVTKDSFGNKQAIIYARVSTKDQAKEGHSLPTQLVGCREYAARNGFVVVEEIADDCSGTIPVAERPGGKRVYEILKGKRVDAVVLYTIDRTTRDTREYPIEYLIFLRDVQDAGAELHFADKGKSEGGIEDLVRAWASGREWEKIRERSLRGRKAKAMSGKWVGSGRPPYGYRKIGQKRDAHLEICEPEAEVIRRIFGLYLGGKGRLPMSFVAIAILLTSEGVPSPGRGRGWYEKMAWTIIERKAYYGEFTYAGHTISLPDLAIISQSTWVAAQSQSAKNKARSKRNQKHDYLLSGVIKCTCGAAMSGQAYNVRNIYYRCHKQSHYRYIEDCREKGVRVDVADRVVWDWVAGMFCDSAKLQAGLDEYSNRQGSTLQSKRERLTKVSEWFDKAERRVKLLARDLHDLDSESGRDAIKTEMKNACRERDALDEEQKSLTLQLSQIDLTAERRARIEAEADEIREGIAAGDVDFRVKRGLIQRLEVGAKVEYRDQERGLFATCILKLSGEWLPLSIALSSYSE